MKVYAIATKTHECYGHGDYGTELCICRGPYGTGEFPPTFRTLDAAQKYLDGMKWNQDKEIVELEVR